MNKKILLFLAVGLLLITVKHISAQNIIKSGSTQQIKKINYLEKNLNTSYHNSQSSTKNKALLINENFSTATLPLNWQVSGLGTSNWQISNSNNAGGESSELKLNYSPPFHGTSKFVSPHVNTILDTMLVLEFKHFLDDYSGGYTLNIETSSDGENWNNVWSVAPDGDISSETVFISIKSDDVGSETFQIAFSFAGNSTNTNAWYIDDILLKPAILNDISIVELNNVPDNCYEGEIITPSAIVQNTGINTISFDVELSISTEENLIYNSILSTNSLISEDSQELTFDSWIAEAGVYMVKVKTLLENDEDSSNNEIETEIWVKGGTQRDIVILEKATGTWCGFCVGAALAFDELLHEGYPIGPIAYHYQDDYETDEAIPRTEDYYGVQAYPTVIFDGVVAVMGGSETESIAENYIPVIQERMAMPTPVDVQFTNDTLIGNTFTAEIVIERYSEMNADNLVLHAILTESHIQENWMTLHEINEVERKMWGGVQGTTIDLSDQDQVTVPIQFVINSYMVPEFCEVVVFVQDNDTKEIYNGNKLAVKEIKDYADVKISVVDEYGNEIPYADIIFGDWNVTANEIGEVSFQDVDLGKYSFTATANNFLPKLKQEAIVLIDNMNLAVVLEHGTIIWGESFDDSATLEKWTIEENGFDNWWLNFTNIAGGINSPEIAFYYSPAFVGVSRFVSPMIDINGYEELKIMFKHHVNYYSYDFNLRLEVSTDGENWTEKWSEIVEDNIMPEMLSFKISDEELEKDSIQFAFVFDGITGNINWWLIDDIWLVTNYYDVAFNISDVNGNPLAGVNIDLGDSAKITDENGTLVFKSFPTGEYNYSVLFDGYNIVTKSIEISDRDVEIDITLIATKINEIKSPEFNLWPNPASDHLFFTSAQEGILYIYSIESELLLEETIDIDQNSIDISGLEAGSYLVVLKTDFEKRTSLLTVIK